MPMQHFTVCAGYDYEADARRASRSLAVDLIARLEREGWTEFQAPPRSIRDDGAWDKFANCRILVKWIEPHLLTEWAGQFAVRVDVLAFRKTSLDAAPAPASVQGNVPEKLS